MDRQAQRDIRRKLNGLQFAPDCGSVIKKGIIYESTQKVLT